MPVYNVTVSGKTYTVEVPNPHERPVRAIVDGEVIEVDVEIPGGVSLMANRSSSSMPVAAVAQAPALTPASVLTPPVSTSVSSKDKGSEIKAPLPGVVMTISVQVGDRVAHGDELCVIEAMKMNNPIRATVAGIVQEILVSVGQQVQHGMPLLRIIG
ncbi:MAG: acetyl-CoA carboxylase biotin carboxyl carrier protein subunit [Anaerolineae bacterium]|nr:acetyl-CoA carboxylase biotin carboxyl carrier protein subunit [Anaerolineae bacterium]